MAINVGSSTASATLRQTQQQNQTQQARTPEETNREQQARQAQQTQKPEQPKPVVNAQGQTMGTRVNTTA
ncbi:MAG TPA: hypothetical protein VF816_15605 [Rhodocyclaceae bacterium]